MQRYIVTVSKDCDKALSKAGNIIFKPKLDFSFLGLESELMPEEIMQIDGVTDCYKEPIGKLCC